MDDWIAEEYGSQENLNEIVHGAQDIKDEYPVNTLGRNKNFRKVVLTFLGGIIKL